MSRSKYSNEFKVNVAKRYLNGDSSIKLAQEYGLGKNGRHLVRRWAHLYELHGESGFDFKKENSSYMKEFKLKIINEYLSGKSSYNQIEAKYKIAHSVVQRWVHKYNNGIEINDYEPIKEVYTMKSRKVSNKEKLEIVKYVVNNNNNYKEAAIKYKVPYANVYQWVKKYLNGGTLEDRRGRPNKKESLSTLDSKDREIIRLKKELELKDLAIKVLKKNEEIAKQMEMDSRSLGKKTNTKQ